MVNNTTMAIEIGKAKTNAVAPTLASTTSISWVA